MPSQEDFTTWQAADRLELTQIWRNLVGEVSDDEAKFQDEAITEREAGYVFQTWITEAFRLSDAEIEPPFRIPVNPEVDDRARHEIDGLLLDGWSAFLIESKFQRVDFGPIARLHVLTESCPVGTMGLLFASKGFTWPAMDAIQLLRPMRVLLFDQDDIECILDAEDRNFTMAVRLKWKAAIIYGRPNYPIARLLNSGAEI